MPNLPRTPLSNPNANLNQLVSSPDVLFQSDPTLQDELSHWTQQPETQNPQNTFAEVTLHQPVIQNTITQASAAQATIPHVAGPRAAIFQSAIPGTTMPSVQMQQPDLSMNQQANSYPPAESVIPVTSVSKSFKPVSFNAFVEDPNTWFTILDTQFRNHYYYTVAYRGRLPL